MSYLLRFHCALIAVVSMTAIQATGHVKEGQRFADPYLAGATSLRLHSAALLRVRMIFKVYVAALYLGENVEPEQVLDDVPKRLEIAYLRNLSRDIIIEAAESSFKRFLTPQALAALRPRIDQINSLYKDVKEGDRYALTYIPGRGCELSLNGVPLGVIEGADFAAAYFGIWLHENSLNPDLRSALLHSR